MSSSSKVTSKVKKVAEKSTQSLGLIYRSNAKPHIKPKVFHKDLNEKKLINQGFIKLPKKLNRHKYVKLPKNEQVPIATLNHGLDRVLFSPGVHQLRDSKTGAPYFPEYLERIHHPDIVDYSKMPRFRTASLDDKLFSIADSKKAKFLGSTSSLSGSLVQLYFLLSKFRGINVDNLSPYFHSQSKDFSTYQKLPISIVLHPKGDIYAIDKFEPAVTTNILSLIGRSMERFVTMEKDDFERIFLKSSKSEETLAHKSEAFNYLHIENFMIRSQLDCYHKDIGIFDIKTRATLPIRVFDQYDLSYLTYYKLDQLKGSKNSYEKEYYDMIRSTFLRNSIQARLGNMDGIFVVYHNTENVFGFEYLKREELEASLYQSPKMADYVYQTSIMMLEKILERILEDFEPGQTINVVMNTDQNELDATLTIFAQEANFNENGELVLPKRTETIPTLKMYRVNAETIIKDYPIKGPVHINDDDDPTALFKIDRMKGGISLQSALFHKTLERWIEFFTKYSFANFR